MVENQAYLFLVFSLTGILIGFLFDIFRVLRKSFRTSNLITYIQDVLFWVLTGFLILFNIWYFNDGEIRIFMFLGIIMGILIYILTLSNILVNLLSSIMNCIKKVIILPCNLIFKLCRKKFIKFINILNKIANNGKNSINLKKKRRNLEENGE